jgi:type III restriction enzyme
MGAFISYLHLTHGINNFFVLAPNLTIYDKLRNDFTPNTPKYVFQGISEFAIDPPAIITGDNYEALAGNLFDQVLRCKINIFNISKINSEVRGGRSPRIKRLSEYIGESYFDYLAALPDLVLIMDESHRYRASAGSRAINELKPVLGLELTATPLVETSKGAIPFKNVIFDYPLGLAMADGFVKEPAVVTRKDFNPAGISSDELQRLKLEDGVRLHESVKVDLETYARQSDRPIVKPFLLVIARDTTHAGELKQLIESDSFFEGRYRGKVIQVDSSKTGEEEDEMIERLLRVEQSDEPTEIVIHVNMLKEGWDVTNLYTIVPLRAANAKVLVEQSIGRGLRLPYGKKTGVMAVDRLNIVAHDKFQEIIDEANRPGSLIRLQQVILAPDQLQKTVTVVSQSQLAAKLGLSPEHVTTSTVVPPWSGANPFATPQDQRVAQITYDVIKTLENQPEQMPTADYLQRPDVQARILEQVTNQYRPTQMELEGIAVKPDIATIVAKTASLVMQETISIPRILVVPTGEVRSGFKAFTLELDSLRYPSVGEELWIQYLRTNESEILSVGTGGIEELRLEDHVVRGLMFLDDISYDQHADLLYDLAGQTVKHFLTYLSETDTRRILQVHQKSIAEFIHAQMQKHYWEEVAGLDVRISKGFSELKPSAYTAGASDPVLDFHQSPKDKSNMSRYLFGGFSRCLYTVQKFQSDSERRLAVILDREALKWFKPARGQFQIYYKSGHEELEYQPDFVAETSSTIYMLEPKARNEMDDPDVVAKRDSAVEWCRHASDHTKTYSGKPWKYLFIAHDAVVENMTIQGLADLFSVAH